MLPVVAASGAPYVAMHWRAHSATHAAARVVRRTGGVVAAVRDELAERVEAMLAAGIEPDRIVLDPGLGFAKTAEHNWSLLRGLGPINALGYPVLVGASRKSFLGSLLAGPDGSPGVVEDREHARPRCTCCSPSRASGACGPTTSAPPTTRCGRWPAGTRRRPGLA